MNAIVGFELCTLSDEELAVKVDNLTDKMYEEQKIPSRSIPARPNDDYDLLVGELCRRTLNKFNNNKMENRYYTPLREEFYESFIYEAFITEKNTWSIETFYLNDSHIKLLNQNNIRVKYLNKEDIEDLGWGDYIPPREYDHSWKLNNWELKVWFNGEVPTIRIINYPIFFQGKIKNKSEFKRLMEQLEII